MTHGWPRAQARHIDHGKLSENVHRYTGSVGFLRILPRLPTVCPRLRVIDAVRGPSTSSRGLRHPGSSARPRLGAGVSWTSRGHPDMCRWEGRRGTTTGRAGRTTTPSSGDEGVVLPRSPGDQACCRAVAVGRARRRPVHQWTARAWVPVVRGRSGVRAGALTTSCTPAHRRRQPVGTERGAAQPRRPASTASATSTPSSAAARTAVQQCETQRPTPAASPRPYAASAPR